MSRLVILAVRDTAVRSFMRPWYAPTLEAGLRSFYDEVRRGGDDNTLAKHPEDFELWKLGEFDEEAGEFAFLDDKRMVARAKDTQG